MGGQRTMAMERRVGVVGLYHSGKTVFLTSLINHLREHNPDLCAVGGGRARIEGFHELETGGAFAPFDYQRYRQALVERGVWPEKTRAVAEYRCGFRVAGEGGGARDVGLWFLDIPGERLADMFMAGQGYAQWSDQLLRFLELRPEYREPSRDYAALLDSPQTDWPTLLHGYRTLLGRLICHYKPIVTPSTFIVDVDGGYPAAGDRSIERLAVTRFSGLAADRQFAPMHAEARTRWPQSAAAFAANFEGYKLKVLDPIAGWLKRCDLLVILVDVTTVLAGGLGMYEGNRELLEHLLRAAEPGRDGWSLIANWLAKLFTLGRGGLPAVEQVAFVATKADKVLRDDRQKMQGLLKDMTRKLTSGIEGLTTTWAVCAAVDSTADRGDGSLEGFPMRLGQAGPADRPEVFSPSRLPASWPENWEAGQFRFPDVLPVIPARRDALPRHVGLHQIIDLLLRH